jgi:hypothetical protein
VTKTDLLSLFKTHGDLSCTTKGESRVILYRHMHLRSCSVQQVVSSDSSFSMKSQKEFALCQR